MSVSEERDEHHFPDLAGHLAEIIWQVHTGDFDRFRRLTEAMGAVWTESDDHDIAIRTIHGVVGLPPRGLDPIATTVQVCMAIFGPLWVHLPEAKAAFDLIKKRWHYSAGEEVTG